MITYKEPLCQAPFKNIRISMVGPESMVYRPCCNYLDYNTKHKNVKDYVESQELADLQNQMMGDKLPKACNTCEREESQATTSLRQQMNHSRIPYDQGIAQLEIFPNNTCNLRCFMCNPVSSSSLAAEYKSLGWISSYQELDTVDQTLSDIEAVPNLHTVSFIGGEFFLAKRATEILALIRKKKLAVRLVTNATVILPQHMEHLAAIQDLELQISLDSVGLAYEFMRYPASWSTVDANIKLIKKTLPQARLNFNFVVQPMNLSYLIDSMLYANSVRIPLRTTNLLCPDWLNWHILTNEEKDQLEQIIQSQLHTSLANKQKSHALEIVQTMHSCDFTPEFREEFRSRMRSLMAHRKIANSVVRDHFHSIPTLADFIQHP